MATDLERDDALAQIAELAGRHNLSANDIVQFMAGKRLDTHRKTEVLTKLFGYLGGLFLFAGIGIYTAMRWDEMNAYAHIVITLGTGLVAYLLAVSCFRDQRYSRAATPLMLIAAIFEPSGMMVTIAEFSSGGDPRYALLVVFGIMAAQMLLTFIRERHAVLLFLLLVYVSGVLTLIFDLLEFEGEWNALVVGFSLFAFAWRIGKTRFNSICSFWYFIASALLLCATWVIFDDWNVLVLFVGIASFTIFLSVVTRSRALLVNGVIAVLSFIGYYTAEYFADNAAWPLGLLFMGAVLVAMSKLAMSINRQYLAVRR